ncbi:MAG: DNA-methyltransferase [Pseudonocardia sp.]
MTLAETDPLDERERAQPPLEMGYRTDAGVMYRASVEQLLGSAYCDELRGRVNLIFTSPPFPLNRKKKYGNHTGEKYLEWIAGLAPRLAELLTPDGSLVMEIGNAWEPGKPVMSTLPLQTLLRFLEAGELNLCQQFVCHNPTRLPTPVQWVNIKRVRVKDSFTQVWWMSPTANPKANNRNVLTEYSARMKALLQRGSYNAGLRPSGHHIGETSFLTNNGGAIPSNVLTIANTTSSDPYRKYCREHGLDAHPAPMQPALVEFFVNLLTDADDLVLDPFGGSNSTGAVAEELGRRWVSVEPNELYVESSRGRFPDLATEPPRII